MVQGIAPGVTNGNIMRIFKNVGECWVTIKSTDSFCVVDYKYQEDAQYAFEKLHGSMLGDQILLISFRKFEKKAKKCFYFEENGFCKFVNKCKYDHVEEDFTCFETMSVMSDYSNATAKVSHADKSGAEEWWTALGKKKLKR